MNDNTTWIRAVLASAIAAGTAIWGWFGWLVLVWAACMALDFLTGSCAALYEHDWNSEKAKAGLAKKGGIMLAVLVAVLLDVFIGLVLRGTHIKLPWTYTVLFAPLVIAWYSVAELGSILENAHRLGAPLPKWLKKALKIAKHAVDSAGDELTGDKN